MALPIAHATAGFLLHRLDRRATAWQGWGRAGAYMAIANLPDADFLIGFALGRPGALHRGLSHTVLAALVFGVLLGAFARWRWRDRLLPAALVFAAVYGSHLLVDAFTIDERGPAGAQFFWPLSDAYYVSPVTLFGEILIDGGSRLGFVASILRWPTVVVLARETALAVVVVGLLALLESWRERAATASAAGLAAESGEEDLA